MKNRTLSTLLLAAVLIGCGSPPPTDLPQPDDVATIKQGLTSFTNPYGGALVTIGVGRFSASGYNAVIFWSNFNCTLQVLANPLADDVMIDASNSTGTETQVLAGGQSKGFQCNNLGQTYVLDRPVAQNGKRITVYGAAYYADYMNCSGDGSGPVSCFAQGGNDLMETWGPNVELWGGDQDDKLRIRGGNTVNTKLFGGNGADCLQWNGAGLMGAYDCVANPPACNPNVPTTCDRSTYQLGTHCQWLVSQGSCDW